MAQAESEGEGPAPGPLLDDLMRDESQFETLLGTLRVLLQNGQASEARALTEHVINVLARRWSDKCARHMHAHESLLLLSTACSSVLHAWQDTNIVTQHKARLQAGAWMQYDTN